MEKGENRWERFGNFWEKVHLGLGAIALGGAAVFPAEQGRLVLFSAWEFGHALIWKKLKTIGQKKPATAKGLT